MDAGMALAATVLRGLEQVSDIAGPLVEPISGCFAFCAWAIDTLKTCKTNSEVTTLLSARVFCIQRMIESIRTILETARPDAPVNGNVKHALIASVAAVQRVATSDAPARCVEMMEEVRQHVADVELKVKATMGEVAEEMRAAIALVGQQLTSKLTGIEDTMAFLVDAFSQELTLTPRVKAKLLSVIREEHIYVACKKAEEKAKKWLTDNLTLMPDELDVSFDQAPLGKGGFGEVYKGIFKGLQVAVKVPNIRPGVNGDHDVVDLVQEAYIMAQLNSPHVVKILGVVSFLNKPMCLVMKLYPQSLDDLMRSHEFILSSMSDKVSIGLQLARGLLCLHEHPWMPVVHGDLKPSNVLVEKYPGGKWECAISDFGSSAGFSSTISAVGTPNPCTWRYAAPEVAHGSKHSKRPQADVYSLGLIIAQMFTGREPYHETSDARVLDLVKLRIPQEEQDSNRVQCLVQNRSPPMDLDPDPDVMPEPVRNLVLSCLDPRPERRPPAHQIVQLLGQLHKPSSEAPSPLVSADMLPSSQAHEFQASTPGFANAMHDPMGTTKKKKLNAEENKLLITIASGVGFHRGRPLAALVIFRCCLQWRYFQAVSTPMFEKIIAVIGSSIESQQNDNASLSYWLSNTVTLLYMLQKNIKPTSGGHLSCAGAGARGNSASLHSDLGGHFPRGGKKGAGVEASIHGGGVGGFQQLEANDPALLFKTQLYAFVRKLYSILRDNIKKLIVPMLSQCIHAPKGISRTRGAAGHQEPAAQQVLSRAWGEILAVFDTLLTTLKENCVPKVLVQAMFKQLFSFVNVQLFNQLLLQRECCSFSNGEYVKNGVAIVDTWIQGAGADCVADSWEELRYIRQAVQFLVVSNKPEKSLEEITTDVCPVLSIQQLYRISTMYWDDRHGTESVSADVLQRMKQQMLDSLSSSFHSFLLDDDSTVPFEVGEVLNAMDDKDLYVGLPIPAKLKEGDFAGFTFLEKEVR